MQQQNLLRNSSQNFEENKNKLRELDQQIVKLDHFFILNTLLKYEKQKILQDLKIKLNELQPV